MNQINRREFLKLASLATFSSLPAYYGFPRELGANSDAANVIVLVFDAWSAHDISLYGFSRQTTPNLERFAERATVYHNHYAPANFTSPGTASLLTGTYPWTHRAFNHNSLVLPSLQNKSIFNYFSENQYHTLAYTHNALANSLLKYFQSDLDKLIPSIDLFIEQPTLLEKLFQNDEDIFTLSRIQSLLDDYKDGITHSLFMAQPYTKVHNQRFEAVNKQYETLFPRTPPRTDAFKHFLLEDLVNWLSVQIPALPKPSFSYIHAFPPHDPYHPRAEFIGMFGGDGWSSPKKPIHSLSEGINREVSTILRTEYDEFIAYTDAELGRLIANLEQSGSLEDSWLVITSDHGEMFERGFKMHNQPSLYEPVVKIPLLISAPGQRSRQDIHNVTNSIDLLPTLLNVIGSALPEHLEGKVMPPFGNEFGENDRSTFIVQAKGNDQRNQINKGCVAINKHGFKLSQFFGYSQDDQNGFELYDLQNDPEELENLYGSANHKSTQTELKDELIASLHQADEPFSS